MSSSGLKVVRPTDVDPLPASVGTERLLLGGIFAAPEPNECFELVTRLINEGDLSDERNKVMLTACRKAAARGLRLSRITVLEELKRTGSLEKVKPFSDFFEYPEIRDIESYCKIVREQADRRRIIIQCDDIRARAFHDDLPAVAADAQQFFEQAANGSQAEASVVESIPSIFALGNEGITWAIDGLLPAGCVMALTGPPESGKSTLAMAATAHIATGEPFLGRSCSQRGCLWIDRENSPGVLCERVRRLGFQDGHAFKIWGVWLTPEPPEPAAPAVLGWIKQCLARGERAPVVVIDSLAAWLRGENENDASWMRGFLDQLRHLTSFGCTCVVLHHSGKSPTSKAYRGSSDFPAAIDLGYAVTKSGEGRLERIQLAAFKNRVLAEDRLVLNYSAENGFSCDERPHAFQRTLTERFTALLRANPRITTGEFEKLADAQQLGRNRSRDFLEDGVKTGDIRREVGPRNSRLYSLIEHQNGAE